MRVIKLLRHHRLLVLITYTLGLCKLLMPILIGLATKGVVDVIMSRGDIQSQRRTLLFWLLFGLGVIGVAAITGYWKTIASRKLDSSIQHTLRVRLFAHLQTLGLDFHTKRYPGELSYHVSSDIQRIAALVERTVVLNSMELSALVVMFVTLARINILMMSLLVFIVLLSAMTLAIFGPRLYRESKIAQVAHSRLSGWATELFSTILLIKASGAERFVTEKFDGQSKTIQSYDEAKSLIEAKYQTLSLLVHVIGYLFLVVSGGYIALTFPNSLTLGGLVLCISLSGAIDGTFQRIVGNCVHSQDGFSSLEKYEQLLSIEPEIALRGGHQAFCITGRVSVDAVRFQYDDGAMVLNDINLHFEPGNSYAIVGPSGGGKSTIGKLLVRLYDPTAGTISIDGLDIRTLCITNLRQQIAVVPQESTIFSMSVADNISFALAGVCIEDIKSAAKLARAHAFIEKLPDGYFTLVGENGTLLSGGERQRIAIARAILRKPRILILDEATNELDALNEEAVMQSISGLKSLCTVIIITHRYNIVKDVSQIFVVDGGRIRERGSYSQLVRPGSLFSTLLSG